ncbi:ubiquitin C-terminal hydrolase [Melampsora larici-populina 98AG31]|uniref:Ubiquitin carboxyl-terminal hydrolase n=1 Tax=Melampsora larici-populina (strain 98AG31 / pathotype 3-4-7) TaxID=747676 RepID=F4RWF3_MELLP|nr:ubiquitin C-terminal hydrolase [Melampsora larici-populina 98AG31]EGG03333.1 ubiquitin C-terminal hydrolase [Melampsora larici-populina 98AG31]
MILVETHSNPSINPIAGPSIPRSFLTSTTTTTTTTNQSTTTPSDSISPLYHFGHSQHQHQASNESQQQQINQTHSSSISKRNPNKIKTQIRHADHLLDTPGVCFASWLSNHSSHLGTVRSTSIINRCLSSSSSSTSSSITLSSSKQLNHQSSSTQITTSSSSTSSPNSIPTQVDNTPEKNISNDQSSLASSPSPPSPPSPSIQSNKTSTPVVTNPIPAKPKSWADLLRTGTSKSSQTVLPSNSTSSDQAKTTNPTSNNLQSSARLLESDMGDLKSSSILLSERLQAIKNSKHVPFIVPRGLINNGNICFANAILQVLVYCVPFYNLLKHLNLYTSHDFKSQTPLLDAMIGFINEFESIPLSELEPIKDPKTSNVLRYHLPTHLKKIGEPFIAESVWIATKGNSRFDAMRGGQQEDAQEFLCFFLDTLHEELLTAIDRHDGPIRLRQQLADAATNTTNKDNHLKPPANELDQPNSSSDGWMEVGSKGRPSVTRSTDSILSPLTSIFGFNTRSILHKPKQKDSVTFEPNNMLQLSIESPNIKTIEEALLNFSTPEIISDMMNKNGIKSSATKQIFIESFPPVFILHLKRFGYFEGEVKKNSKSIKFGNFLKIPASVRGPAQRNEEVSYKLFAVVYHHGLMASGGHYTVSIKQQITDEWIYFDDTIIKDHHQKFPNEDFNQDLKTPYLLFYTRSS